jgi:hypothetical protein
LTAMYTFPRTIGLIFLTCLLSLCAVKALGYIGSAVTQGYRDINTQLYYDGTVKCWNRICPGKTTYSEAKGLTRNRQVLYSDSYGFMFVYSDRVRVLIANKLGTDSAPVATVALQFTRNYLTVGDLLLLLGNPTSVERGVSMQVLWLKGMCFSSGYSAFFQGTQHRIQSHLSVVNLVMVDPSQANYCASTKYIAWNGLSYRAFDD